MHRPEPAQPQLVETQEVPAQMLQLGPPLFKLAGLAIGNGLTDPKLQVMPLLSPLQDVACVSLDKQNNLINITKTKNTENNKVQKSTKQKCYKCTSVVSLFIAFIVIAHVQ